MKVIKELLKYNFKIYLKSNKFVMPFVVLIAFLLCEYAYAPVEVVDSYNLSMMCVFLIMVWIGLTYNEVESPISEQLLILKIGSEKKLYISNTVFLILISVVVGVITVVLPLVINAINNFNIYSRPIILIDVLIAFILHCFAGFTGSQVGLLFHPRIIKERKVALLLTFLMAIMSIVKVGVNTQFPMSKFFTWIFPPIADATIILTGIEYYTVRGTLFAIMLLGIYGVVMGVLRIYFLMRNKF